MRKTTYSPAGMIALTYESARMMAEAQAVIAMRVLGWGGMWGGAGQAENNRMVAEKQAAFAKAGLAMWGAMLIGARPEAILRAGVKPVGRTTADNVKRLTKLAPRFPCA